MPKIKEADLSELVKKVYEYNKSKLLKEESEKSKDARINELQANAIAAQTELEAAKSKYEALFGKIQKAASGSAIVKKALQALGIEV